ncbi:MAG: Ger(x)C family spore germination protein [Firmicutes bacterium]|nr:Ger(x)C family spore germination protein [Bacillota bacterium]
MKMQLQRICTFSYIGTLMILLGLLATGCWSARELNERALVVGVGIDPSELPGQIAFTFQILKPAAAAPKGGGGAAGGGGGGGGGEGEGAVWVVSASGYTPFEAIRSVTPLTGRKLFWGHVKVIIVNEVLARNGITRVLDYFIRNQESRRLSWILIARGCQAKDILAARSELEKIPIQTVSDQLKHYRATSTIVPVNLHRFMSDLAAPGRFPVAPGIEMVAGGEKGKSKEGAKEKPKYARVAGTAVFSGDRLAGWLDARETRGFLWIIGQVERSILVVRSPGDERERVGLETIRAKSKVKPEIRRSRPAVAIEITEEGNIGDETGRTNLTDLAYFRSLEQRKATIIQNEVLAALDKTQKQLRSDIFGFGLAFSRKFPKEWKHMESHWPDQFFPDLPVKVKVHARLRETGVTTGPALIR